jgi:hypothetical protein
VLALGVAWQTVPLPAQTPVITVNGTGTGLTFEGIGALSAGASSRLLIDYPEPQRSQILDYLFKPNYGASLQNLKIEIGGDVDSTDGAEPSHMHSATDSNFNRGYEWWLMQQAKLRNPNMTFGALEWGAPSWIGNGAFYSQDNINYIISFIQGAQANYGIAISYVGIWNETPANANWVISLKQALVAAGLNTLVVAADQDNLDIVTQMINYPPLVDAIDVVGIHYPNDPVAVFIPGNKRLWATEAGPWRGDWNGAQTLAKDYNEFYVGGRITRTVIWSLITSYYDFLPIPGSGLMYANTPWSGSYNVQPAIWATAHTTQFAQPGWQYIDSACGHLSGTTFATLKKGSDYSIIIETSSAPSSQTVTFNVTGGLSTGALHVWKSDATTQFVQQSDILPANGSFTITLAPGSIYSLTTTTGQSKGDAAPPTATAFPFPYLEDFESYSLSQEAKYFSAIEGSFEVVACGGGRSGQCLRQAVEAQPIPWPEVGVAQPASFLGSTSWTDYRVTSDVFLETPGESKLIGRLTKENENSGDLNAYQFYASSAGSWRLCLNNFNVLASGAVSFPIKTWHTMSLILNGTQIQGVIDGVTVASITDNSYTHGMAGVGLKDWTAAQFDNFRVDSPPGITQIIPQSQMTAAAGNSAAGFPASNVVDGDTSTFWQTDFTCVGGCHPLVALPQSITVSLGGSYNLSELRYLPRQDGSQNGIITSYNVYVSGDGTTFTLAATGSWAADTTEKSASLSAVNASYVRLEATATVGGYVAASEITVRDVVAASNLVPAITLLNPNSATAGAVGVTLTVTGSNFVNGSVVRWNGADRPTVFVSDKSLTASIAASDLATAGSATVAVYNPPPGGGLSNSQTFTIGPSTVGGGPATATTFVTGFALNAPIPRNDFSGFVGMVFTVGQSPLYVSSLGRVCVANNAQAHVVKLVNAATGSDVPGASASLNMAGCVRSQFVYGALPATVTLAAGTRYYFASAEVAGGDQWYDSGQIATTSDATVSSAVYFWNGNWYLHGAPNNSYVPANFQYSLTASQNPLTPVPAFSPAGGTFTSAQVVSLSDTVAGATIYYTIGSATPTTSSAVYLSPISVSATTTIQAFATAPGMSNSAVSTATYIIQAPTAAGPTFSPVGGVYTSPQSVLLSDTTAGASIYYTTDGSTPTTGSPIYSTPIPVSVTTVVKSLASAPGYANSPVTTATYSIQSQSATGISFVTGLGSTLPNARRDFSGWVGMKLTVGANPLFVNSIGRVCIAGNSAAHSVKFVNASTGADVASSVAQVSMRGCVPGQFVYITLSGAVTLKAGGVFYLVSEEAAGGDQWYDFGPISATADAAINNSLYSYQGNWYAINGPNTSYVPPNFQYSLSQGPSPAATPSFSPVGGVFTSTATVSLASTTPSAVIYYTLDGSTPTTASPVYGAALVVNATTTIKAVAAAPGFANSAVASATYTIQPPTAATPAFSPIAGVYTSAQTVSLSDSTAGATIYYTLDGSVPTGNSSVYSVSISVGSTTTIKAIAVAPGFANSAVASATYTIQLPTAATPTFSPVSGVYTSAQTVSLSDSTAGATIYYTLDGSAPTSASLAYSTSLSVSATTTVNAIAIAPGFSNSAVATAVYTIQAPPTQTAPPAFTPAAGTYTSQQSVTLTDPGATIYYTIDGSAPTSASTVYTNPIPVSSTTTIKAIATSPGLTDSSIVSATYTIQPQPTQTSAPSFAPPGGAYTSPQSVTLTDSGATIYYTTDGSAPTTASTVYSGAIAVASTTTVKAIAIAPGMTASTVASATYTISQAQSETPFVTGYALSGQRLRSDFSGWVGMKLTVGPSALTVTSLGRLCITGNTGTHTVKLLTAGTGVALPGGSAQINMSGCTAGQFTSVALSTPVTLAAGASYYLASQETAGGDKWYDLGQISTTIAAASNNSIYSYDGSNWLSISGSNTSYVPPTFGYLAAPPDPNPPFVTSFGLGNPPLRKDFSGWVGMKLTVGSAPLSASFLGRACVAGNSSVHTVKFVDAASGADVSGGSAAIDMTGCTTGQFVYTALASSISLGAGKTYYLVSQELSGGDQWYDFGSIAARSAASVNSAVYGVGGSWYAIGSANMSYVPPNFK